MDSTFPLVSRKKWLLFTFVILLYCIFLSGSKNYKHKRYVNPFAFYRSQNISSSCRTSRQPPPLRASWHERCAVLFVAFHLGMHRCHWQGAILLRAQVFGWNIAWGMKDSRSQHTLIMECIEHTACAFPVALYAWHGNDVPRKGFERILMHRHIAIDDIVDSATGLTAFGLGTCPVSKCVCWPELRFIPDLPWNLQFPLFFLGSEGDGLRTLYPSWRSGSLLLESQTWP